MITTASGYFHRLHLPSFKEEAASTAITLFQQIQRVYLPLCYGDEETSCRFTPGDRVFQGDRLTPPEEEHSLPTRSPVEGVFEGVRELSHPLYGPLTCAVIRPAIMPSPQPEAEGMITPTPAQVVAAAKAAAIIDELDGMPLYRKLEEWKTQECDYLIADAVEAEPYATSAYALLREQPDGVSNGLWLAAGAVDAAGSHIAVQLSRKQQKRLSPTLKGRLFTVPKGYPVRTYSHAGRDTVVRKIGPQACLALHRAVTLREPHHCVYVTVSGDAVEHPQTLCVPFGTPIGELLRFCGLNCNPAQIIMGDAISGMAVASASLPVLPGVTCLLAMKNPPKKPRSCVGCGRCLKVCPAHLKPEEIAWLVESMHYDRLEHLHPERCLHCGGCSVVCPSGRDVATLVAEAGNAEGRIWMNWGDDNGL